MNQRRPPAPVPSVPPAGGTRASRPHLYLVQCDHEYVTVCIFCEQMVLPFDDLDERYQHFCCPLHDA